MNNPLVSVCIPTYNGEKYIQEALDSIKKQTYRNIEVIISDDSSTDKTREICEVFKDEVNFPVYIFSHQPAGIGSNWNNSIAKANGEYIKFLFQDDLLASNCIEVMLYYLLSHDLDIILCKRIIISEDFGLEETENWLTKFGDLQKGINLEFDDFYLFGKKDLYRLGSKYQLSYNFLGEPVTSLFSKKLYNTIGEYSTELKQMLDIEYYLRILIHTDIGLINKKLISFRIHNNQTSTINENSRIDESKFIDQLLVQQFNRNLNKKQKNKILYNRYPFLDKFVRLMYRYKIFN
ncbi:glycosyltransferase [Empedobacter falsenii]|uniref:glycosyltransferase family 2 protein n=1 Tax=Empedobacter falsenii TaxID=343874 RepID=UPI00257817D1|nr:glycosyltransferase [Empedobacter falsenii]MDM1062257.1 glycosyltransferase [Empedobacter falsenii]